MNSFEILSKVIEISNAPVDVDRRLKNLVDMLAHYFSAPLCALFLWDTQQARLVLKSTSKKHPALPDDLRFSLNEGPLGTCASQKVPMIVSDTSQLSLLGPPCPKPISEFRFMACFPVFDDIFLYGVLAFLGEEPRQFLRGREGHFPGDLPPDCRNPAGWPDLASSQEANRRVEHSPCHRNSHQFHFGPGRASPTHHPDQRQNPPSRWQPAPFSRRGCRDDEGRLLLRGGERP